MTIQQFSKPLDTAVFITTITDDCTAVLEIAEYRGIHHRGYWWLYRVFKNRSIPRCLPARLLMTIPRFLKPLNTAVFITAITYDYTAVFETAQYRLSFHRGYWWIYRGLKNQSIPRYLSPRLLMTIPRSWKPLNTVLWNTAVSNYHTATFQTVEYRGI